MTTEKTLRSKKLSYKPVKNPKFHFWHCVFVCFLLFCGFCCTPPYPDAKTALPMGTTLLRMGVM